ncbi:AAA family ATPase [Sorangium sp. So ce134]
MLLKSLRLDRFLSFGPGTDPIELSKLNVLIGANGSGKSNFIEAIDFLRSAPADLLAPVRQGGG